MNLKKLNLNKVDLSKIKLKKINVANLLTMQNLKIACILLVFVFGIVFIVNNHYSKKSIETMENMGELSNKDKIAAFNELCPNILIRKGKQLHLLNTRKAQIPGVNPIKFDNLEEYAEFVQYQKKMKVKCPILYYQETYNTQNSKGLRLLNDPLNPNGGLDSNMDIPKVEPVMRTAPMVELTDAHNENPPFNKNNFSGFDDQDQYIGVNTELDKIRDKGEKSANPMAPNWGGHAYTQEKIDDGTYEKRTRDPLKENKFNPNFVDEY